MLGDAAKRVGQPGLRINTIEFRRFNHYVRDVVMLADASRIRVNPGIFARARSFALNILRANGENNIADALWCNALDINRVLQYRCK